MEKNRLEWIGIQAQNMCTTSAARGAAPPPQPACIRWHSNRLSTSTSPASLSGAEEGGRRDGARGAQSSRRQGGMYMSACMARKGNGKGNDKLIWNWEGIGMRMGWIGQLLILHTDRSQNCCKSAARLPGAHRSAFCFCDFHQATALACNKSPDPTTSSNAALRDTTARRVGAWNTYQSPKLRCLVCVLPSRQLKRHFARSLLMKLDFKSGASRNVG